MNNPKSNRLQRITPKYRAYHVNNFRSLPEMSRFSEQQMFDMEVVAKVLPFKSNSYVVEQLIDWKNVPDDPIFRLTFPNRDMLLPEHFTQMAETIRSGANARVVNRVANSIRRQLNPHPAGQEKNVPILEGTPLPGVQHKYRETALFFPSQGQTCHAYCSFCFRWPQFVGMDDLKFAMKEADLLIRYLRAHPEITNLLFTGGDPMVMSARNLRVYLERVFTADLENLDTIRIGTKFLGYWPYKVLTDPGAEDILALFREVVDRGLHVAVMAHFNHPRELETEAVQEAIYRIRSTGAEIRTQSPLLNHINADSNTWLRMWKQQVRLGCIPYYMFVCRDTGAQHYFNVPLAKALAIYKEAFESAPGLARTARGPSMSADPGKIQVLGTTEVNGEKLFVLQLLQARNPHQVLQPFFAEYDENAVWIDELKPAFGADKFFFEA